MSDTPLLSVKSIRAGYVPGLDIIQGLNLYVNPGELIAVIGPNGAGKSTLAKCICGLVPPHTGTITFQNQNVAGLKPNEIVKQGMCYVSTNC